MFDDLVFCFAFEALTGADMPVGIKYRLPFTSFVLPDGVA